ncbi:MAG: magnesium/cobalt transporter CorA [PVC group bacterium]
MITIFLYDQKTDQIREDVDREEIQSVLEDPDKLLWLDMEDPALEDYDILRDQFRFHPLLIRDCINPQYIPKCDEMDDYIFLVLHSVYYYREKEEEEALSIREIDFFVGKNFLVTVHNGHIKAATVNRDLCRKSCKIMAEGSGRLLYHILDTMADNYIAIINKVTDRMDSLEDAIIASIRPEMLTGILEMKRNIMTMRKVLLPQSELIYQFCHGKFSYVRGEQIMYFKDIYDHMVRITSMVENLREMGQSLLEAYHSTISFKLNDVMKVLTVIATIMMPMTLISGIGGMNVLFPFALRESLTGFWILVAFMLAAAVGLLIWFKKIRLM